MSKLTIALLQRWPTSQTCGSRNRNGKSREHERWKNWVQGRNRSRWSSYQCQDKISNAPHTTTHKRVLTNLHSVFTLTYVPMPSLIPTSFQCHPLPKQLVHSAVWDKGFSGYLQRGLSSWEKHTHKVPHVLALQYRLSQKRDVSLVSGVSFVSVEKDRGLPRGGSFGRGSAS